MENQELITENDEFIFNRSIKGILIDSLLNTNELFLNSFGKKLFDSHTNTNTNTNTNTTSTTSDYKMKLKINSEYKNSDPNTKLLESNKYGDLLTFRANSIGKSDNNDNEKINKEEEDSKEDYPIITSMNFNGNLGKDNINNFGLKRDELALADSNNKKQKIDNASAALAVTDKDKDNKEKNELLEKIPEKYRIKGDEDKNQNLVLSLYKNQNHISFRKDKLVSPDWHAPWKLYRVISGHTGWVRCIDVDPTNNW